MSLEHEDGCPQKKPFGIMSREDCTCGQPVLDGIDYRDTYPTEGVYIGFGFFHIQEGKSFICKGFDEYDAPIWVELYENTTAEANPSETIDIDWIPPQDTYPTDVHEGLGFFHTKEEKAFICTGLNGDGTPIWMNPIVDIVATERDEAQDKLELILKECWDGFETDGVHHKQYALDQILRIILKDRYEEWMRERCYDKNGEQIVDQDVGIP